MSDKRQRTTAKGRFTRSVKCLEEFLKTNDGNKEILERLFGVVEEAWRNVEAKHEAYVSILDDDADLTFEESWITEIQERYHEIRKRMDLEQWKRKRRNTTCIFLMYGLVYGTDCIIVAMTIIPYLEELVHTKRSKFYYTLSSTIYSVVCAVITVVLGHVVDKSRHVRYYMYLCTSFGIAGNILYIIYYYPAMLLLGRALCGVFAAGVSVWNGELIRCYNEEEAARIQWWYAASFSTGMTIGSWISLSFTGINFSIGPLQINRHNFVGLFTAGLMLVQMVSVFMFVSDCSKEYDLKQDLQTKKEASKERNIGHTFNNKICSSENDEGNIPTDISVSDPLGNNCNSVADTILTHDNTRSENETSIKDDGSNDIQLNDDSIQQSWSQEIKHLIRLVCQLDIVLILFATFWISVIGYTVDTLNPILVLSIFKWSEKVLDIGTGVSNIIYFIGLILLSKICVSTLRIYRITILGLASVFICISLLLTILCMDLTMRYQIILMIVYQLAYEPVWLICSVTLANMLGKMVSSNDQSFAESFRSTFSTIGCIISGIILVADVDLRYLASVLLFATLLMLLLFIIRRKRLRDIQVIDI